AGPWAMADDTALLAWDVAAGKELWQLKRQEPVIPLALAFSPDGKTLVAGNGLRDAATGKLLRPLTGLKAGVQALAFSPKGDLLAAGDRWISLFDPATGKELRSFGDTIAPYRSLAFAPEGATLAAAAAGIPSDPMPSVRLWDAAKGKEIRKV